MLLSGLRKLFSQAGYKNYMEEKTYPAMDLPVYGESDGANFILVEDWIRKLWVLI